MNVMSSWCYLSILLLGVADAKAATPAKIAFHSPHPHQVIQRVGFDPTIEATQQPGTLAFGYADVTLRADVAGTTGREVWEYRLELLSDATGKGIGWTRLETAITQGKLEAVARVPAGGWYRLELRGRMGDAISHQGSIEPIGVGEVFVVAGQSYASNSNDERFRVEDPQGRVVAFNSAAGSWAVGHDPQPTPDGSDGGSIWPLVGDALLKEFRVPIGFANVAFGGTSSRQWLPEGKLHAQLIATGKTLGNFRAVLWQQGESDVIEKSTMAKYIDNVKAIRAAASRAFDVEAPWLLAKSTHHPTVYNDSEGEARIRAAIDALTKIDGFQPGPDTDTLKGDNRGGPKSRRHFSAIGQRHAAEMWFTVLRTHLRTPRPLVERIGELQLLQPAWASAIVHRESSVLLQMQSDGPITARLAFPASHIVEVVSADRRHRFDPSDVTLSDDGLVLTFLKRGPIEVIKGSDLYLPKDAPNSYRHRVGNPDQYLLYRPGRWFHDRNVEITYRRKDVPAAKPLSASLPKTMARLKKSEPLTLGISGDSISTGLDASGLSKVRPNQPGYPDLVAAQLRLMFHGEVVLKNRAVSGWSVANGVADLDKLLAEKPHLIVIAYGMNDVGRRDPKWFNQQTRTLLDRIRAASPDTEVVLVAPMLGNAEWIHTPREMFAKYRDELQSLTGPGIALADLTEVWQLMLRHKHDFDLTGNGLNHPNDFGHRLYAQAILQLFR